MYFFIDKTMFNGIKTSIFVVFLSFFNLLCLKFKIILIYLQFVRVN